MSKSQNSSSKSFRGKEIPEVFMEEDFIIADSQKVINDIIGMSREQRTSITLEACNFKDYRLENVKLSTGDIIPIETAIALAEKKLIKGYTTGMTSKGTKILRSNPGKSIENRGLYQLPRF